LPAEAAWTGLAAKTGEPMAPNIPAQLAVDLANALSKLRLARKVNNPVEIGFAEGKLNALIERIPRDRPAL